MVRVKTKDYLLLLLTVTLNGCMLIPMKNSVEFNIHDGSLRDYDLVYKNNWPKCGNFYDRRVVAFDGRRDTKYITSDSECKVEPDGYVPDEIVLEYALWLTYEQQVKAGLGNSRTVFNLDNIPFEKRPTDDILMAYGAKNQKRIEAAIDKLPASAWHKIVLHPKELAEKYRHQMPEGDGERSRGKLLSYQITFNQDGTYKVESRLLWMSPISKNWN